MSWRFAILAALALLASGCGERAAPAADGPVATTVDGHYAEEWGQGSRTVLLLPHSGWAGDGPGEVRALRPVAKRFVELGWRTLSMSYAPGRAGLATVAAGWRAASKDGPACIYGESSGGHWALVLAARDAGVGCAIAAAAPTDLVTWPRQIPTPGPRDVALRLRAAAFGLGRATYARYSPARRWPPAGCSRVLLLNADDDPIVPLAQARELLARTTQASLVRLRAGDTQWVHSKVRAGDLDAAWGAVQRTLDQARARC